MNSKKAANTPNQDDIANAENKAKKSLQDYSSQVFKSYLSDIAEKYDAVANTDKRNPEQCVACFDITKLVIEENSSAFEKLKNVYHILAYSENSIGLVIRRTHENCRLSLAVGINKNDSEAVKKLCETIRGAIIGNFPGSSCSDIIPGNKNPENCFAVLKDCNPKNTNSGFNSIAIASNIASEFSKGYLEQGLEKIIDGIVPAKNEEYTIILLAQSLNDNQLEGKRRNLYQKYTWLSPLAKRTENWSFQESSSWGKNINGSILFVGTGENSGGSHSKTEGASVEITQYEVSHTMEIIEKQMERIEHCAALGAYDFAAYVLSSNCQLASEVAHMYMSLTQGNESYYEKPSVNVWNAQKDDCTRKKIVEIEKYLRHMVHPVFCFCEGEKESKVKATAMLSGAELTLAMSLPGKSLPGFTTIHCAAFGREITSYDSDYIGDVSIGRIHHMHRDEEKTVELNKDSLTSHIFVTGSTGSGKTNTIYTMLDALKMKFMVVEPAKGEYKYAFGSNVKVYGTNPNLGEVLKINPFAFNNDIHVFEHIDRLLDVFNACWPMYAAMPEVLKDAIIRAYEDCGWDMVSSSNRRGKIYPTFEDVCSEIDGIINASDYSDENKGNYRGSLKTRLKSLTNGVNRLLFCNGDVSDENLFEQNVIIDLSRLGSSENKSLIMGLMIIRLQEYRMSEGCINSGLRHVTVLEEAHNILRRAIENSGESGNLSQKSVEMLANAIAEMRTYGEGFIIADQAPGLLDMSVIRNTNTKIILRLPDQYDRELVGRAANLSDLQINELASLQRGVAAIYQNEWTEPVLCKIFRYEHKNDCSNNADCVIQEDSVARMFINSCVYDPMFLQRHSEKSFIDCLEKISVDGITKARLLDYVRTPYEYQRNVWQKAAFSYFKLKQCKFSINMSLDDLKDTITEQIQKYDMSSEIDITGNSEVLYRFTQIMTYEAIVELGKKQPEIGMQLSSLMKEHKSTFFKL